MPPASTDENGYATVDAIVGLMIMTATLALSMNAITTARKAAEGASQTREATALLRAALDDPSGALSGTRGELHWSRTIAVSDQQGVRSCRIEAEVRHPEGRRWTASTLRACPEAALP